MKHQNDKADGRKFVAFNYGVTVVYLTTSSVACERNFSSLINLEAALQTNKINKLLFVRNHLHKQTMEEWARDSSEKSSDEKAPDSDSNI